MNKVLIVDDNRESLKTVMSFLSRFGKEFVTITADSGENAMNVLKESRIDLVVTDLVMPQVDGLSLLAHINELYPRTLCIAMTGYATDNIVRMLPSNLLYLMRKPFKLNDLIGIIRKSLKNKPPGGTVGGISISSFLRLIEMDEKSCALDITLSDGRKGRFLLKEGELLDAFLENMTGEEAAIEMIRGGERAIFTLNPLPHHDIARRINCRIMELLLKESCHRDQAIPESRPDITHRHAVKEIMALK